MSIIKGVSYTFGAQLINTVISFATSIYVSRLLGPEGRGMYAIFQNSLAFAVLFFGLSINSTIVYLLNTKKVSLEKLFNSLILFSCVSAVVVIISLLGLGLAERLMLVLPEGYHSLDYVLLFGLLYFNTLLNSILAAILSAHKKFKLQSLLSLCLNPIWLFTYAAYYYTQPSRSVQQNFSLVIAVTTVGAILSCTLTVFAFLKEVRPKFSLNLLGWSEIKLMLAFSSMTYVTNVLQFFSYRLDFWFIDAYCGKADLGIYSLATQLAQLLWMLPNAVAAVLYSYVSSATQKDAIAYTVRYTQITFYGTLFLALAEIAFFLVALPMLYGEVFRPAIPVMALLVIGVIPFAITTILASYFAGTGLYKLNLYGSVTGFVVAITLYPTLIKQFGMYGGAIASSASYLINTVLLCFFAANRRIPVFDFFSPVNVFFQLKSFLPFNKQAQ